MSSKKLKNFSVVVAPVFRKRKIFKALSRLIIKFTLISSKSSVVSVTPIFSKSRISISVTSSSFSSFSFSVTRRRLNYINILNLNIKFSRISKTSISKSSISHSYFINLQLLFNEKNIYDEILLCVNTNNINDDFDFKELNLTQQMRAMK